ncbi:hypothetical protein [Methanopyrus sp.]
MAIETENVNEILLAASLSALKELGESPHTIAFVVRNLLESSREDALKKFLNELKKALNSPPGLVQSQAGTKYEVDDEDGNVIVRVRDCSWKSVCEIQEKMGGIICSVAIIIEAISKSSPVSVRFNNNSYCVIKIRRVKQ